jgi:Fur family zinc uptake transcriptional regulator
MRQSAAFPALQHDHDGCVRAALDSAEETCERNGARLTDLRRHVLRLVWASHAPMGAYAILDALNAQGHAAAPPTVYRALEFLRDQGLIHRVESLNAYIGCAHPDAAHTALVLLCTSCHRAAEFADRGVDEKLRHAAASRGFAVARQTIEVEGLCPDCRRAKGADAS